MDEIKSVYNARRHPDVMSGKRTEDEVLLEFMETFEETYSYLTGTNSDGKVTLEEFVEYYEGVSMSIDDDAYFEVMMNNAWRMNENTTSLNEKKGWSDNTKEKTNKLSDNYNKKFRAGKKPQQQQKNRRRSTKGSN